MAVSLRFLLLVLVMLSIPQGDCQTEYNRLNQNLEGFFDDLEYYHKIVSEKQISLAKHADTLRSLAGEVDKVHKEAAADLAWKAGAAVGGDLINIGGLVLEFLKTGSPLISVVGQGISLLGAYAHETAQEDQLETHSQMKNIAEGIFRACERDLEEMSGMFQEMVDKFSNLEQEQGLLGTVLHKKLMEIKIRFPHFQLPKIKGRYINVKSRTVDFMVNLATASGGIRAVKKYFGSSKEVSPAPDGALRELSAVEKRMSTTHLAIHLAKGAIAAVQLYQDGKDFYQDLLHLKAGARSELAESLWEVASSIDGVIETLHGSFPEEMRGRSWWGGRLF
ncbi:uncharacterized protein [Ambystoma mexicanum]|uniref:uncharacterized protein n=1 Tax=Ambystoma mexicanum TaxID=8296 RepID=UPI0037E903EA